MSDLSSNLSATMAETVVPAFLRLIEQVNQLEAEREALNKRLQSLEAKAKAFDVITTRCSGAMTMNQAAKFLMLTPKNLRSWMYAHKWIYRTAPGKPWLASQEYLDRGLLAYKGEVISEGHQARLSGQVLITPKGLGELGTHVKIHITLKGVPKEMAS